MEENGSLCLAHWVLELTQIPAWKRRSQLFECRGVTPRVPHTQSDTYCSWCHFFGAPFMEALASLWA